MLFGSEERLRRAEKITLEAIEEVARRGSTVADADYYMGGLVMGVAAYLMKHRGGRRTAYDYFQGFADDLVFEKDDAAEQRPAR